MAKLKRAELLSKLVEDAEGYDYTDDGRDEWRDGKRQRKMKSFRESNDTSKSSKDKRRAYNIQRAIRRGDYDFGVQENKTPQSLDNEDDYDD